MNVRPTSPIPLVLLLGGFLCLPLAAAAGEQDPLPLPGWNGFVQTREQFPLTTGFLIPEPTSGFVLSPGRWRLDVSMTLSNSFSASKEIEEALDARRRQPFGEAAFRALAVTDPDDESFYVDAEIVRTAFRLHRGFGRGLELGVMLPVVHTGGGFTDGLVEAFHDLVSLDQEGRKGVTRDAYSLFLLGQGTESFRTEAPGTRLGDLVLTLKKVLWTPAPGRSLALGASVKLPTGDEESLTSSGAVDAGVDLVGSWCWTTRCLHGSTGVVRAGRSDVLGTDTQELFSLASAFEQRLSPAWTLTLQAIYWQSYLEDLEFRPLAEESIQLGATLTVRLGGRHELSGGFGENSFSFKNSADTIWYVGWRRWFR